MSDVCEHGCSTEHGAYYDPCRLGVHVCGGCDVHNASLTEANFPTRYFDSAVEMFEQMRLECSNAEGEPTEFVVDLMLNGDCVRDFSCTRQMLSRIRAIASSTLEHSA